MPIFRCNNSFDSCYHAVRGVVSEVTIEDEGRATCPLDNRIGGFWARSRLEVTARNANESQIVVSILPKLWIRIFIQLLILSLCLFACWYAYKPHKVSITEYILLGVTIVFVIYLVVSSVRCTASISKLAKNLDDVVIDLMQIAPPQILMRPWEFALMSCWIFSAWILLSIVLGWSVGIASGALLLGISYFLPTFTVARYSFRACLYIVESDLIFSILMFCAALFLIFMYSFMQSMLSNRPDATDLDFKYFTRHVLVTEWQRADQYGTSNLDYGQILSTHLSSNRAAGRSSRNALLFFILFTTIGFWGLRRNRVNALSLMAIDDNESLDKLQLPQDGAISSINLAFMKLGCILAGLYRWIYVIFSIDVTASIWFGDSVFIKTTAWVVHVYLSSLTSQTPFGWGWSVAGILCIQMAVVPGLLIVVRVSSHLISLLYRDCTIKRKAHHSSWTHPAIRALISSLKEKYADLQFKVIAESPLPQIAEAEYYPLSRYYVIKIDPVACEQIHDQQLKAIVLHEIHHLLYTSRRTAWLKVGSMLLLSPCYSLNVFFDFHQAEYDADLFACKFLGNTTDMISSMHFAEMARAKIQALQQTKENVTAFKFRKLLSFVDWVSPLFLYNVFWAAAYPSTIRRTRHILGSSFEDGSNKDLDCNA